MRTVRSQKWGYVRIIAGTIVGGIFGFYVMHRLETSYKAKWDERLKKYQQEKLRKENSQLSLQLEDDNNTLYFPDNPSSSQFTTSNE